MRLPRGSGVASAALILILFAHPASAQVFGKNKVQYEPLEWSVLETTHLRLHYYAEEESLARRLVVVAESVCVEFDGRFRLPPRRPIPFLLYSVHHLFQQTNATSGLISEGTGGLTELIKGRVLLPHTGSWSRLVWVTRHELTHAYTIEKISRVMREHRRNQNYLPPLWFTEGIAEFCGTTWDADAEGLLRDAVISGEATPLTQSDAILGTVLMYKEGQSFLIWLAEKYGRDKIFDLFDNWYRADDFETTFRITFGVSLRAVDEEWFDSLRRRFYPAVAQRTLAQEVARRLTPRGSFNLGPRVLPNRDPADTSMRFCYFNAGEMAVDLMINEPRKGGKRADTRLLRGGASTQFESFHLFQNRPDASPTGLIAVSSKRGGRDVIYIVDAHRKRRLRTLDFPNLVAIHDPALVPGDTAVVFSAQDYGGRSDLYRARWTRGIRLERMTDDDYDDIEPDVSPDGRWVAFASDRCERGGRYSIYRFPLAGGGPERVSDPPTGDDRQPVYSPDGKWIAFRSNRSGTSDLYLRPSEPSREARRVTRLIGPAMDPDWVPNGHGLLFTAQQGIRFQTYMIPVDPETLAVELEAEAETTRVAVIPSAQYTGEASRYQRRLSLDLAQNAISFDPGLGSPGGVGQVALSDVLGNEQIYLFLSNDAERFGNFWDGFEGGVTYINRARRLNWGLGAFRLTQVYDADLNTIRRERRLGMLGLVSYPFDKFRRIEGSVLVRHASDHLLRNGEFKDADLVSNYVALVHDNSRWSEIGPSSGERMFLSAGFTRDMSSGAGDFATLIAELRHYAMPLPHIVSATRVQGQSSLWRDAQTFYLGGWGSIRGYELRALSGTRTLLVQQELRFPLLRGLVFSVPAPWLFPTISGAVFADAAWTRQDGRERRLGSAGLGFFMGGGYFPALRWNYVWISPDLEHWSLQPRTQFTLGYNF